jgi:V8-like Glu-specific endopeptidase
VNAIGGRGQLSGARQGTTGGEHVPAEPPLPTPVSSRNPRAGERDSGKKRLGKGRALVLRSAVMTTAVVAAATVLGVALNSSAGTTASSRPAASEQTEAVGALFTTTPSGGLASHFCSASVVDSPGGDLILTAAHCMHETHQGSVVFVPGYSSGKAPYGVWTVTRVIEDQDWQSSSDPDDDFAFLVVHRAGSHATVQQLVGANALGIDEPANQKVTVTGYPSALDTAITCDNTAVAFSATQLQFDCAGFADGTSGGPFLINIVSTGQGVIVGVIGGYEQGGATASVSYAARFGPSMKSLYETAIAEAGS